MIAYDLNLHELIFFVSALNAYFAIMRQSA